MTGNKNIVWSVAFSPDGKRIVSGGDDTFVRMWLAYADAAAVCQAHHQYKPPAVAGLGGTRYRLRRSLSRTTNPSRWLKSNDPESMASMTQQETDELLLIYGIRKQRKAIKERQKAQEQAQKNRAGHRL